MIIVGAILLFQKNRATAKMEQAQRELKMEKIRGDALEQVSSGYYRKLLADTLTKKELKKLAEEIVELKGRKPISITKTIIQPIEVSKNTDIVEVNNDSIYIEDYYPSRENSFLKYTNRLSIENEKGFSKFKFDTISLKQVVTRKDDGLYQIDFVGPEFLEVKSLNIQTEPIDKEEDKKDNFGTLLGVNYGKNVVDDREFIGVNAYLRIRKFYIGIGATSNSDITGGVKVEL